MFVLMKNKVGACISNKRKKEKMIRAERETEGKLTE